LEQAEGPVEVGISRTDYCVSTSWEKEATASASLPAIASRLQDKSSAAESVVVGGGSPHLRLKISAKRLAASKDEVYGFMCAVAS